MILNLETSGTLKAAYSRIADARRFTRMAKQEPAFFSLDSQREQAATAALVASISLTADTKEGIKTGLSQIIDLPGDTIVEFEVTASGAAFLVASELASKVGVPVERVLERWAYFGSVVVPDRYRDLLGNTYLQLADALADIGYNVTPAFNCYKQIISGGLDKKTAALYYLDITDSIELLDIAIGAEDIPAGYAVYDVEMSYEEAKDAGLFGPVDYDDLYDRGVNFEASGAEFSLRNLHSDYYVEQVVQWGLENNRAVLKPIDHIVMSDYKSVEVFNALTGNVTDNT